MAKKNIKSYNLYHKGKRLTNEFKEKVKEIARIKKVDISTGEKLHDYYTSHKDDFYNLFEIGLELHGKGSGTVFRELDKGAKQDHEFYFSEFGEEIKATAAEIKYDMARVEQKLNEVLESTGVAFSYVKKLDGTVIIQLPTDEEIEELNEMTTEEIADYLEGYGIKIYTSDPKNKNYEQNEQKRKAYEKRIRKNTKRFRKDLREERAGKATKSKGKGKTQKPSEKKGKK